MTSASKYHGVNKKKTENNDFSDPTVDEVGSYIEIDSLKNYQLKADLSSKQTKLEVVESIDMNRLLEKNIKIHLIKTNDPIQSVDEKKDVKKVLRILNDN